MQVAPSGAEVPAATIVTAIAHSDTPATRASADADSTSRCPSDQRQQPQSQQGVIPESCATGRDLVLLVRSFIPSEDVPEIGDEQDQHRDPFPALQLKIPHRVEEDQRRHEQGRGVPTSEHGGRWTRAEQRRGPQDKAQIEDVRPDDVAERDIGFSPGGREERHDDFGRRGTERDHRHPDDEIREAFAVRDPCRRVDDEVGTLPEQDKREEQANRRDGQARHHDGCFPLSFRRRSSSVSIRFGS